MTDNVDFPDNSDNVLQFTKRFDDNADIKEMRNFVEAPKPEGRTCRHERVVVSEHERSVKCRLCSAVLDPFDYLLALAKKETRLDWELTGLRHEIRSHREGLEKLKREEANCKGRLRNAQNRLSDINGQIHAANQELQFVLKRVGDIKLMTGNQNA
ncbi:hypothetical protein Dpoa2040_001428 [Dickeya sp. CFBP 2040]|uniref:hypothetical protein n=1 Tax=Dickeya sp. CFBP 2040 TaxID=2718531 RepID=UPI0014450E42|nr:hypothetical protein [Dickeya sp. CFBP 2040]NKI74190.1 hypothetical protein [Dickeya sp. CFBP 2040]